MQFRSIEAHLEVFEYMCKFNLEARMLPEVIELLNLISVIMTQFDLLRGLN